MPAGEARPRRPCRREGGAAFPPRIHTRIPLRPRHATPKLAASRLPPMAELAKEFDAKKIEDAARRRMDGADLAADLAASPGPGGRPRRTVMFVEGPPTMNGTPHVGHLRGRVVKDYWYRYTTMRGARVVFNAGWDTQGLPVELQAQKELGIEGGGRDEIVRGVGVERLVAACKGIVKKYNERWVAADRLLGMSMDHGGAYWTYADEFIEREWQVVKRALESGILEVDHTVIAYCPSCQTSLSHAEVNQGYEEVTDPSLYYKVRLGDAGGGAAPAEPEYLVVWTTMPFTLVTDAMVGVHPDEEYRRVRVPASEGAGGAAASEVWIVGASRMGALLEEAGVSEYEAAGSVAGSELDGRRYEHPLYEKVPALRELAAAGGGRGGAAFHTVVADRFVDANAGSGLVHLSPANGEEDIRVARERGVSVFCPIDDAAAFTAEAGAYSGLNVRDADRAVVDDLRAAGALVRIGRIRHKYPLCWRSRHRIVWLARRGWFYKLDRLGDAAVRAAESAEYFFEQPRNRFLAIVGERHPWCISRERFWGCPLPAWTCTACGHTDWLFTRAEVAAAAEASGVPAEGLELHRPWLDRIATRCSRCGGRAEREPYVLDTWHNSGSAPYSSLGAAAHAEHVPVQFLTEGIDQTRGWAYTLLVENVILAGGRPEAPFRSFLFQGHVLDEKGGKMSKSLGNVVDAERLLSEDPVDLVRFYLLWKASPIEPLSFDRREVSARPYQVASTLYHLHLHHAQNSSYDGFDAAEHTVGWAAGRSLLGHADRWLLSRLQGLVRDVTARNDACRLHEAVRAIDEFVVGAVSQSYVPAVRAELWDDGPEGRDRRLAIHAVMREALRAAVAMLHPACPFLTEHLYAGALGGRRSSVLLEPWPEPDESLVDEGIERSFGLLGDAASACAAARMKAGLKRRWPLSEAVVCVPERLGGAAPLESLPDGMLAARLNVERCEVRTLAAAGGEGGEGAGGEGAGGDMPRVREMLRAGLPVEPTASLDRKRVGARAGRLMAGLPAALDAIGAQAVAAALCRDGRIGVEVPELAGARRGGGGDAAPGGDAPRASTIELTDGDFVVGFRAADGYAAAEHGGMVVILSTRRSEEMAARGLLKDLARRIQALRKERGCDPAEMLDAASVDGLDARQAELLGQRAAELAFLVRARAVDFGGGCSGPYKDEDIDGQAVRIAVKRAPAGQAAAAQNPG